MISGAVFLFVLFISLQSGIGGKHSLYYFYTIQSKDSLYSIYDYTVLTLLNNRQIDFYSSTDHSRTHKSDWIPEIYWESGKIKLKDDGGWLNEELHTLMNEFGHSESDGHFLQWRHGCEGEDYPDGSVIVLNSINEYGYDGEDLMYFKCTSKKWMISDKLNREKKETLEEKWNKEQRGKAVIKCEECEEFLRIYSQYRTTDTKHTEPDVQMFMRKSVSDPSKLNLTCLATGFYPKDVMMSVRKYTTALPEHLVTSSGVRLSNDGTYQLRKSVEIQQDDEACYDCYVSHRTLSEPITAELDKSCQRNLSATEMMIGGLIGVLIGILIGGLVGVQIGELNEGLIGRLLGRLIGGEIGRKIGVLIGVLIGVIIGVLIGLLIGKLIAGQIVLLIIGLSGRDIRNIIGEVIGGEIGRLIGVHIREVTGGLVGGLVGGLIGVHIRGVTGRVTGVLIGLEIGVLTGLVTGVLTEKLYKVLIGVVIILLLLSLVGAIVVLIKRMIKVFTDKNWQRNLTAGQIGVLAGGLFGGVSVVENEGVVAAVIGGLFVVLILLLLIVGGVKLFHLIKKRKSGGRKKEEHITEGLEISAGLQSGNETGPAPEVEGDVNSGESPTKGAKDTDISTLVLQGTSSDSGLETNDQHEPEEDTPV